MRLLVINIQDPNAVIPCHRPFAGYRCFKWISRPLSYPVISSGGDCVSCAIVPVRQNRLFGLIHTKLQPNGHVLCNLLFKHWRDRALCGAGGSARHQQRALDSCRPSFSSNHCSEHAPAGRLPLAFREERSSKTSGFIIMIDLMPN